ncbi:MAG: hypothetical protein RL329_2329 [Bacteroidota bacterium]
MNYFFKPIFWIIIGLQTSLTAQSTIQGMILNDRDEPIEHALISIWRDTILLEAQGTQTNEKGFFKISIQNNLFKQHLNLQISHLAYQKFRYDLPLQSQNIDLNRIALKATTVDLNTAVISAQREAVRISGDTAEFAASAYPVQPNAPSEDLLKKVPDVEINRDGTVKARGETVKQVLINGKPFFGKDPRIALQSLPADAIESIKIYEKKSEQATFSGIDDGEREMTIDLKIKPAYNNRNNGKFSGGFGTADRHSERGIFNQFEDKSKLTALIAANNINKTGFSEDDFLSFANGNRNGNGGRGGNFAPPQTNNNTSKGFRTVETGGANWILNPTSKIDINLSYFYNHQNTLTDKQLERFNFLPTQFFTLRSQSYSPSDNRNHRFNAMLDYKIDTFTSIRWTATATFNKTHTDNMIDAFNRLQDVVKQSRNQRMTGNDNIGNSGSSMALLRRRLSKAGRTVSAQLTYNYNNATQKIETQGITNYFRTTQETLYRTDSLNQADHRTNYRHQYTTQITYTEPFAKRWTAETSYRYMKTDHAAMRNVLIFKQNSWNEKEDLKNNYNNLYQTHRANLGIRYVEAQKLTVGLGMAAQESLLKGDFLSAGTIVNQSFRYFLPNTRLEYTPNRGTRYAAFYETSVQEPSIDQLQPIRDNTDPLNIWLGDPNLKPEYTHRIRTMYHSFQRVKSNFWSANADASWTKNKIVNALTTDSLLRRINKPLNLNENQRWFIANARLSGGFRWLNQALRVNQTLNGGFQSGVTPVNGADNRTQQWRFGISTRVEYRVQEIVELVLKYSFDYTKTQYDLTAAQRYNIQDWEAETNWTITPDTQLSIHFDYNLNHSTTLNNTIGIPLLNLRFSRFYGLNRRLECRFLVVDALNRNSGVTRTADSNYFQTETVRSLGRYGLMMFVYSMNSTPKKRGEKQERNE